MSDAQERPKSPKEFSDLIDSLKIDDFKKEALRARWLDQVKWMSGKSKHAKRWYYRLRITAILGGILIPALVNVNVGESNAQYIRMSVFALGLLVAASAALEEFLRFGEKWRHYRQTIEALKTEGWQFFQQVGAYSSEEFKSHAEAYPKFASRVEDIIQRDVGVYVTEVVAEKKSGQGGSDLEQAYQPSET